jgi:hypothetical protein
MEYYGRDTVIAFARGSAVQPARAKSRTANAHCDYGASDATSRMYLQWRMTGSRSSILGAW